MSISTLSRDGAHATSFEGMDFSWIDKYDDDSHKIVISEDEVKFDREVVDFRMDWAHADFRGGQIVPSRFTVVSLFTELPHVDEAKGFSLVAHVNWAEAVLQHLIDVYRGVADDAFITMHDTKATQIVLFGVAHQPYTFNERMSTGAFSCNLHHIKIQHPILFGRRRSPIDQPVQTKILEFLRSGKAVAPHERILLQARELISIDSNYEMSIITSGTAFEVFLQNRLGVTCERIKTQTLPARNSKDRIRYLLALETGNVQTDLLRYVDLLAPAIAPIKTCPQYSRWKSKAYDVRNKIIHRGQRDITESQANDAFLAVQEFIAYLESSLP